MPRLLLTLMLVLAAFATGCKRKPTLHVYNWEDYIKDDLIAEFEKEFKCRVVVDNFDSNEKMLARMQAGATGYDLIFPTSYMVQIMRNLDMIQPLDLTKIPNARLIDPMWLKVTGDPEMKHSVPYMVGYTVLAYRKDKVPKLDDSWNSLMREDLKGRITLLDDMRETIGAALMSMGFSCNTINDDELAAARDLVIEWKRQIAKFDNEQYKNGIASGEFFLVHGYTGDLLQVAAEDDNIVIVMPREGILVGVDHMAIPKGAKNVELAHQFIDFLHRPEVAAANTEEVQFLCPNTGAYPLLSSETRDNPAILPPAAVAVKAESIADLGANNAKYSKIWDEIKAAR